MLLSLLNSSSIFSNESTLGFINIGGIELSYTCISTHIQTHALTHVKLSIHMENAIWLFSEQCTLQIIIPTRYVYSPSCPTGTLIILVRKKTGGFSHTFVKLQSSKCHTQNKLRSSMIKNRCACQNLLYIFSKNSE